MAHKLTDADRVAFEDILIEMDVLIEDLRSLFTQSERHRGKQLDFSAESLTPV